jgi:hypothetical protein
VREQHVFDVIGLQAVVFEAPPDRLRAGADHLVDVVLFGAQDPRDQYPLASTRCHRGAATLDRAP